jgi:hypothetical protein
MKKCLIKDIKYTIFYYMSTFVISFYYGSGSAKQKVTVPTVPEHWLWIRKDYSAGEPDKVVN